MFARPRMFALWYPFVLQTNEHDSTVSKHLFRFLPFFSKRSRTSFSFRLFLFLFLFSGLRVLSITFLRTYKNEFHAHEIQFEVEILEKTRTSAIGPVPVRLTLHDDIFPIEIPR